jgi:uncharacterized protein
LPGVIAGSVIRVELIPGPKIFDLVVSAVLLPLGSWLTATGPVRQPAAGDDQTSPVTLSPAGRQRVR